VSTNADAISVGTSAWRALAKAARRPRLVLQTESAECGLACLAMVANHYGFDIDLVSLRHRYPGSARGMDLNGLIEVAAELHLSSRALRAEVHEIKDVQLPCILHWGTNHFVVLSAVRAGEYEILDPARGRRRITALEFERHFSGIVLELVPAASFSKAQLRRELRLSDLWTRACGLRRSLGQVLLLSLLLQLLVVGAPLYTQLVLDAVVIGNQWELLRPIAMGFGLLIVVQAAITLLRSFAILHLSNRLSVQMATNLFHHLVRLPLSYFLKRHLGDLLSRFQSLQQVRQMMTTGIVSAWLDGLMVIVTLIVMLYYSLSLTCVVLAIVAAYVLLRVAAFQKMKQLKQEQLVASANESSHFMETLRSIQALKIFQKEADREGQWVNRLTALVNKDTQIAKWDAFFVAANTAFFGLENILVVYLCVRLVEQQQFSLGMLFAFVNFKVNFTRSTGALINQCADFLMLKVHFERISDIAFSKQERHHLDAAPASDSPLTGAIEVRNLGFCFEGSKRFVFRNLSFTVAAGETLAIVGPSGSGKTTLLKCLLGLIEPSEGEILIDGVSLRCVPNYRRQIAAVMQDDQLISGSIKDNIAFFAKDASMERIQECAVMACIHQEIMRMPMRYDTLVGDLGSSLSGGQKQRVILARALYRSPRILFMDEATSHLDVAAEASVNQQISRLEMTRVLVAHRPETVRAAGKWISIADAISP
jgi:ATP-binding cassette, subfamily B, bacterial CvaB/MchF/RaxB